MNLEALLAIAKPFLFHEDTADAALSSSPSQTLPTHPTPTTEPARPSRPASRWFLTPHALLRRNPWGRYALLGVFHRFPDAAEYAAKHCSFGTSPTTYDTNRSAAAWQDDIRNTYIICPHPNPNTPLRINEDHDPTTQGTGPFHLRYADRTTRPVTQAKFPTAKAAYACLAMSHDLSRAEKTLFEPEKGRWEWVFRHGVRYIIKRTRWSLKNQNTLRS